MPTRRARHALRLALVWMCASIPFFLLHAAGRRAVMNEIRNHAQGMAACAAFSFDPQDLAGIRGPDDARSDTYRRLQQRLQGILVASPDIRYAYIMRRSSAPQAEGTMYEYVVDSPAHDFNGDGHIDRDEQSEPPGTPYDATRLPAMIHAWQEPDADASITSDPPYPDVLSGYAPIRGADGRTVALLGVDVTAGTVREKRLALIVITSVAWLLLSGLLTVLLHYVLRQREGLQRIGSLNVQLTERNDLLLASARLMARESDQLMRERRLVQTFQTGLMQAHARRVVRKIFDQSYLTAWATGPGLLDVFDLDADHVGFYHAEVPQDGEQGPLAGSLIRTALFLLRERHATGAVDLTDPAQVAARLNEWLLRELPSGIRTSFLYGVINIASETLRMVGAGHPWPLSYDGAQRKALPGEARVNPALGREPAVAFSVVTRPARQGDRLLVYGESLLQAENATGSTPGEDVLLTAFGRHVVEPAELLLPSLMKSLSELRSGRAPDERASVLLINLK